MAQFMQEKNLAIKFIPLDKSENTYCIIDIPFPVNPCVIDAIHHQSPTLSDKNFDISAIAYALYININEYMITRTPISNFKISGNEKSCLLSFEVCNKMVQLRKILSLIISRLKFSTVYSLYARIAKEMNVKTDRNIFDSCIAIINKSILSGIKIIIYGKLKLPKPSFIAFIKKVSAKVPPIVPVKASLKLREVELKKYDLSKFKSVSISANFGDVFARGILCTQTGYDLTVCNGKLWYPISVEKIIRSLVRNAERRTNLLNKSRYMQFILISMLISHGCFISVSDLYNMSLPKSIADSALVKFFK